VILQNWSFSGFIDVGHGGIGDRHIDLYWGCWSLLYNLKEERWCSRFLDAYGRQDVDVKKLRILDAYEVFG
jgi:kanamycin kinase